MKYLIASFLFLSVSSAFACPNLSGTFDCGHRGSLEIKFHETGYEFVEDGDASFVPNDNISHQLDETTSYVGFCKESSFHIRINGINENVGPLVVETAFFLDENNDLAQIGGLKYSVDGKEETFPYGYVCKRVKDQ